MESPSLETGRPSRSEWVALTLLLILAAVIRLHALGHQPLWLDEQIQFQVARQPDFAGVWREALVSGPIGPVSVLDNAVALRVFGESRSALRLPQALEGILAVGVVWWLGRIWFSPAAGLFAASLLSVHSLHIQFSREARGYSLLVLLTLLQSAAVTALFRQPTWARGVLTALATWLAVGVHPLAAITTAALGAAVFGATLLAKRNENKYGDKGGIGWTPLLSAWGALGVGAGVGWLVFLRPMPPAPQLGIVHSNSLVFDLVDVAKALIGGYWGTASYAVALAIGVGVVFAAVRAAWRTPGLLCLLIALAAAAPVLLGHLKGWFVVPRYSLFATPFLMLLGGAGFAALLPRRNGDDGTVSWREALQPVVLAAVLLLSMHLQGRSPYDLEAKKFSDGRFPVLDVK